MSANNENLLADPKAYRQQVKLAATPLAQLNDDELAMALAYEVEPFSKIPASEARVGWREMESGDATLRAFDVAVKRKAMTRGGRKAKGGGVSSRPGARVWIFAMLAAAAIATDAFLLHRQMTSLRHQVAERRPYDAELKRIEHLAADARSAAANLRERRKAFIAAQDRVEELRGAHLALLDAVAEVCGGRTVVKSFASDAPFSVVMEAVASDAQAAADAMCELTSAAASRGWSLEPGAISASQNARTVNFSCRLVKKNAGGAQ